MEPTINAGVYLGMSPNHASSVALVLNLATGHVSPQFHVVFDDEFSTVQYLRSGERPPFWEQLVEQNTKHYGVVDPRQEPTSLDWSNLHLEELKNKVDGVSVGKPEGAKHTSHEDDNPEQTNQAAAQTHDTEEEKSRSSESESAFHPSQGTEGDSNRLDILDLDQSGLRRSQRTRKPPDRLVANALKRVMSMLKPESRKFLFTNCKNLYRDY